MNGDRDISEAWGHWLEQFEWDHMITLTFKEVSTNENAELQVNRWIRRLQQRAQQNVNWFIAGERGVSGLLHLHAWTGGTRKIGCCGVAHAWPCGRTHVVNYVPRRGGTYYVSKNLDKPCSFYDFNIPGSGGCDLFPDLSGGCDLFG
jgi:hypothetical protein